MSELEIIAEEKEKILTDAEILSLELKQKEQYIIKLEQQLLEREIDILKHKQARLKQEALLLDLDIYKSQSKSTDLVDKLNKSKESAKTLNKQLADKYNLKANWGYNPESGKIVE